MKKVLLSLTLALFITSTFAQDTTQAAPTKADYLRKSRSQKSAAWILLGTGIGSLFGAAATYELVFWGDQSAVDNSGSTALAIVGVGSIATSVTLFVSAGQNRRKAALVTLVDQPVLLPQQVTLAAKTIPAIQLRIPL